MKLRVLVLVAAVFGSTGSFAAQAQQNTTPAASSTTAKPLDPNEVVCEKQEVIGSRLATKRVCMTRSQWADQKGQDRQEIDRVQTQRGDAAPK